jgi:hypothetical protein
MNRSPVERENGRAIQRVLEEVWDPLYVKDIPEAKGEYNSYIWPILALLKNGASRDDLVAHLLELERGPMGLNGQQDLAEAAAAALLALKLG